MEKITNSNNCQLTSFYWQIFIIAIIEGERKFIIMSLIVKLELQACCLFLPNIRESESKSEIIKCRWPILQFVRQPKDWRKPNALDSSTIA